MISTYLECQLWYEQFKICSFVTGGNGSSVRPPTVDGAFALLLANSCALMVVYAEVSGGDRDGSTKFLCQTMTPLLCEFGSLPLESFGGASTIIKAWTLRRLSALATFIIHHPERLQHHILVTFIHCRDGR
jgi:hypothetical protein